MAYNRGKKDGCCSVDLLKTILYIFNTIFLIAGFGVLGIAIWTIVDKYQYVALLSTVTYPIITYFLLAAGALVLLVTLLGCCAVCKNNRPFLICYIFLLLLIFLVEAMVGILAYIYRDQVQTELETSLNSTFLTSYHIDADKTKAIDQLQEQLSCCGAIRSEDWEFSAWRKGNFSHSNLVPDSCCKTIIAECGIRNHPSNINDRGCINRMIDQVKSHLIILSAVGLGICVLQLFGIIFSCQLYFKLRNYGNRFARILDRTLLD